MVDLIDTGKSNKEKCTAVMFSLMHHPLNRYNMDTLFDIDVIHIKFDQDEHL